MKAQKNKKLPEFETIEAAIQGDAEAINRIVFYFQPFINRKARRKCKDEYGKSYYVLDEDMKRQMETKLITKILDFKIQI